MHDLYTKDIFLAFQLTVHGENNDTIVSRAEAKFLTVYHEIFSLIETI